MKELIDEALELIENQYELAKLIHSILTDMDDEMKVAFKLAWKAYHNND